jgi:hypothetical protein
MQAQLVEVRRALESEPPAWRLQLQMPWRVEGRRSSSSLFYKDLSILVGVVSKLFCLLFRRCSVGCDSV